MRRKYGALVPFESSLLAAAVQFRRRGVPEFHGYSIAKHLVDVSDRRLLTAYGTLFRYEDIPVETKLDRKAALSMVRALRTFVEKKIGAP